MFGRVARVPYVFAGFDDGGRQLAEHHGHVRTLVESILSADRFDRTSAAVADGNAHAVAADQAAAFVGDRVSGFADVEFFVGGAGERFELLPERLLFGQMAQAAALEEVAGELADLQQEAQVAALRGDSAPDRWKISMTPCGPWSFSTGASTSRKSVGLAAAFSSLSVASPVPE